MRSYFHPHPPLPACSAATHQNADVNISRDQDTNGDKIFDGYFSDEDSDDLDSLTSAELDSFPNDPHLTSPLPKSSSQLGFRVSAQAPPPRKRQKLAIPARVVRQQSREKCHNNLTSALHHIEKLIRSNTMFLSQDMQNYKLTEQEQSRAAFAQCCMVEEK